MQRDGKFSVAALCVQSQDIHFNYRVNLQMLTA